MRYAEHFIGMFALLNYPIDFQTKIKAQELVSFYVCEEFRSFGVGAALFKEALKICHKHQANTLVWDTLNPNLNGFWQRRHAQIVCDSQILGQPTTLFRIDVPKPS
jgi:GNAT superfamily N-acetyltransferase